MEQVVVVMEVVMEVEVGQSELGGNVGIIW